MPRSVARDAGPFAKLPERDTANPPISGPVFLTTNVPRVRASMRFTLTTLTFTKPRPKP
jgi:hypothetical protein